MDHTRSPMDDIRTSILLEKSDISELGLIIDVIGGEFCGVLISAFTFTNLTLSGLVNRPNNLQTI